MNFAQLQIAGNTPRFQITRPWFTLAAAFGALIVPGFATAQPIFHSSPDWVSADHEVSTGAALVDLDLDGWQDFVVANGNDIYRQRLVVYYNRGDGTFPASPDWQSGDQAYNGHLDIADVNGDGYPDVAVAILLNEGGPAAKVYMNNEGTLSSLPDWTSDEKHPTFGVAFGDVNNDGRPDLAVATGWPYNSIHDAPNFVHLNIDGALETAASWVSDEVLDVDSALWADANNDGWLDLVFTGCNTDTWIYTNNRGVLETTASWRTTDNAGQFAIMAACGDVDDDGDRDLFVTDNTQLFRGNGRFRRYNGLPGGYFEPTPSWSYFDGYGSAIALADVDGDGDLDLATGAWWDYTRLFFNNAGQFGNVSDWQSGPTSVIEKIVFGEVNPACGVRRIDRYVAEGDGDRQLFHLPHQPIDSIISVRVDGVELVPSEYTYHRDQAWISVSFPPFDRIDVRYARTPYPDMAISNWDSSLGNYLYYNQRFEDCNNNGIADGCDIAQGRSRDRNGNGVPDECDVRARDNGGSGTVPLGAERIHR